MDYEDRLKKLLDGVSWEVKIPISFLSVRRAIERADWIHYTSEEKCKECYDKVLKGFRGGDSKGTSLELKYISDLEWELNGSNRGEDHTGSGCSAAIALGCLADALEYSWLRKDPFSEAMRWVVKSAVDPKAELKQIKKDILSRKEKK